MVRIKRLCSTQVKNAKPPKGKRKKMFPDGGNLGLQATRSKDGESISRSWLFDYELNGERHSIGLGPTHTVSLGEARDKARELRKQLLDGVDPLAFRRAQDQQRRLEAAKAMSFGQCCDAYIETHDATWENDKHRQQWRTTLTNDCSAIRNLPVKDIDTDLVLRVLTPIWKTKTQTASRVRARIERVLAWAKGRGLRTGENPARWSGHLAEMLAAPTKIAKVKHHAALPFVELPAFVAELRKRDSLAAAPLEFAILTASRTGEVVGALWSEIDLDEKVWVIPASRMKADREHRVPLSDRALAILKGLPRHGDRVFDSLSDDAMLKLCRRLRPGLTTHGFRSSFRDWVAERTSYPAHVAEAALAHTIGDRSERAYRRGDVLDKRRRLMAAWSEFCARPADKSVGAKGNVTPLRKRAEASA
jgi:integrase